MTKSAQHSVHLTGGSLRHFQALSTPEQNPALEVLSKPAQPQLKQNVRQPKCKNKIVYDSPSQCLDLFLKVRLLFYMNFVSSGHLRVAAFPAHPRRTRGVCYSVEATGLALAHNC